MRLLDANIFLRYFIGDGGKQAVRASNLMHRLDRGDERGHINALVLFEVIFMLGRHYGVSKQEIRDWMSSLFFYRGLSSIFQSYSKKL